MPLRAVKRQIICSSLLLTVHLLKAINGIFVIPRNYLDGNSKLIEVENTVSKHSSFDTFSFVSSYSLVSFLF